MRGQPYKFSQWQLIYEQLLSLEINRRTEASNRPSVQRTADKIQQTASQTWCLIRFLPQMIGNNVPEDHEGWQLFILLRSIMDLVLSPKISIESSYVVDALVEEHHTLFKEVWNPHTNIEASKIIIDVEVSRLAIGFQKVCITRLPQCTRSTLYICVAYSTSTGSILFKQYFHKSGKTYQLTNQSACLLKPTKFLIPLVNT